MLDALKRRFASACGMTAGFSEELAIAVIGKDGVDAAKAGWAASEALHNKKKEDQ